MLRKLYKHEFYSLFRSLIPVYLCLIGLSVISRLTYIIKSENTIVTIFKGFTTTLFVLGIIALFVVGAVVVVVRFYKHLLSKEGYLTFTLPVKPSQHLACKLVCGTITTIINIIVAVGSLLIIGAGTDVLKEIINVLKNSWSAATGYISNARLNIFVLQIILMLIIGIAQGLLMLYTSMSIGQLFKSKIGGAVVTFICLYAVVEIIDIILVLPFMLSKTINIEEYLNSGIKAVQVLMVVIMGWQIVLSVVYFIVSRYMLTKKLNLE